MVSASKPFDENYAKHSIVYSTKNSIICGAKNVLVYHIKIMNQGNSIWCNKVLPYSSE